MRREPVAIDDATYSQLVIAAARSGMPVADYAGILIQEALPGLIAEMAMLPAHTAAAPAALAPGDGPDRSAP